MSEIERKEEKSGVGRTACEEDCKTATVSTRTSVSVELSGLRLRPSPGQRDQH